MHAVYVSIVVLCSLHVEIKFTGLNHYKAIIACYLYTNLH